MSVEIRKYAFVLALAVLVILMGVSVGKTLFQNSPWYVAPVTPEEAAYQAVVTGHPLAGVVEAVEQASPHAIVFGHEYVTNTNNSETAAVLWTYFDKAGTEEEFVALHEVALRALVEAFPDADTYLLVWAVPDPDTGQARGMYAVWLTKIGVSIALQHEDYHDGLAEALTHNEAGNIPMADYGYPELEDPWFPRPEGYVYPWEGWEDVEEAPEDCGCGG